MYKVKSSLPLKEEAKQPEITVSIASFVIVLPCVSHSYGAQSTNGKEPMSIFAEVEIMTD